MESLYTRSGNDEGGWQPFELIDFKPLEGDPDLHLLPVREESAGVLLAGFATGQPSKFEFLLPFHETIYLIEGEVRVEADDGSCVELGPGDSGAFAKGTLTTWTIKSPMKEFFVLTD